jgi:hypothetical protein
MPTLKLFHRRPALLTARDFAYVCDEFLGETYQCGSYLIGVGRETYACNYQGRCFKWGLADFLSAVETCARHEARRNHGSSRYTQRCQLIEEHGRLTSEQE